MAKSKSRKRRKWIILTVGLLAITGGVLAVVLRPRDQVITVQTEPAQRRDLTELVVANGKIQPVLQVVINPEVSGEIVELPVKEGQQVKRGEVLVQIKRDNYAASVNSAQATYQSALAGQTLADANRRKTELEYRRFEKLHQSGLVSESEFQEAKTAFEVAQASHESSIHQVAQAHAALARARDDLSKTTIAAPMDGTVTRLRSQQGERVVGTALMAGTEIMTIADLDAMEARVDIGEMDIVLVALGQKAHLEVDAFRDCKFSGMVTEIANAAKGTTGSGAATSQEATKFEVKIRVEEQEAFRPGMSVTAELETRYRTNVLTVPIQSVTTRLPKKPKPDAANASAAADTNTVSEAPAATNATPNSQPDAPPKPIEVVFVVEGDQVKMVPVKRGISDDNYVEITEGLTEGQRVVSGGYKAINRELEDGKKVKIGVPEKDADQEKK